MARVLQCKCGKKYRVDDSMAGRRVTCQNCSAQFVVPSPKPKAKQTTEDEDPLGANMGLDLGDHDPLGLGAPASGARQGTPTPQGGPAPQVSPQAHAAVPKHGKTPGHVKSGGSKMTPLVIRAVIAVPVLILIVGFVVVLVLVNRVVNPDTADPNSMADAGTGNEPAILGSGPGDSPNPVATITSPNNPLDGIVVRKPTGAFKIGDLKLSPSGEFVWFVSERQDKSLSWDITNNELVEEFPNVSFFANAKEIAVGYFDGPGEMLFTFELRSNLGTRIAVQPIQETARLGQFAGDDQAAIYATDTTTTIVYEDGTHLEKYHDPISAEWTTRWTLDLARRYYYDGTALHRYQEETKEDFVLYQTGLEGKTQAALAPDAGKAVITNGSSVEVIDLDSGQLISTLDLPYKRGVLQVDIALSGNTAAVSFKPQQPETRARGNVEIIDLRSATPKHLKSVPLFVEKLALNREGTKLAVFGQQSGSGMLTLWDLKLEGNVADLAYANISVFVAAADAATVSDSGGSRTDRVALQMDSSLPRIGTQVAKSPEHPFKIDAMDASDDLSIVAAQEYAFSGGQLATWSVGDTALKAYETEEFNRNGKPRFSADGSRLMCGADVWR